MSKHLITIGFLVGALVCYGLGFGLSAMLLVAVGLVLELVFWLRLVHLWLRR